MLRPDTGDEHHAEPHEEDDDRGPEVRLYEEQSEDDERIEAGDDDVSKISDEYMALREILRQDRDQDELRWLRWLEIEESEVKAALRTFHHFAEEEDHHEHDRDDGVEKKGRMPDAEESIIRDECQKKDANGCREPYELPLEVRIVTLERVHGHQAEQREHGDRGKEPHVEPAEHIPKPPDHDVIVTVF